jgi:hypothetical protein
VIHDRSPQARSAFGEECLGRGVIRVLGDREPPDGELFRDRTTPDRSLESERETSYRQVAESEPADCVAPEGEASESDPSERETADGDAAEGETSNRKKDTEGDVSDSDPSARDSPLPHSVLYGSHGHVDEREPKKLEARTVTHRVCLSWEISSIISNSSL